MCFCLGFACAWLFWGRVRCSALSRGELRVVCDERRETKVKIAGAFGHDTRAFDAHVVRYFLVQTEVESLYHVVSY